MGLAQDSTRHRMLSSIIMFVNHLFFFKPVAKRKNLAKGFTIHVSMLYKTTDANVSRMSP